MPSMKDELMDHGFDLKSYKAGNHKTTCPRCGGANKGDMCMSVAISENDNAIYSCEHCGWSGSAGAVHKVIAEKPEEYVVPAAPENKPERMPEIAVKFLTDMGITKVVWERNRLFYKEFPSRISIPFYYKGQLFTVKSCKLTEKKFKWPKGPRPMFYGLDDLSGHDTAIIVQDDIDKLTLEVCGLYNVISVPDSESKEYLDHAHDILKGLKKVIIALNNDKAGKKLEVELVRRIGKEKCFLVEWPKKNANESLLAHDIDAVCDYINTAKAHPIHGLYEVLDFRKSLVEYFTNGMKSGASTGWNNLNGLYSVPLKRFTVISGISSVGKSEWLDCLIWNLAKMENWKFAIFSPENGKETHVAKLAEKIVERPIDPNSPNRMTLEEFSQGSLVVHKHFKFIVSEDFQELPTVDWILDKARAAILRHGIKGIVIDPYNEIHRDSNKQEKDFISEMLSKIRKFVNTYDVHIWIVAHPTKMQKDKDGVVMVPTLQDISGAQEWHSKPDFGIIIHRSEGISGVTEVHVKKARLRWEGRKGVCSLIYDTNTGTYSEPGKSKGKHSEEYEPDEISFDA